MAIDYKEYEGKNEREAIAAAVKDLGLNEDQFDVEIVNSERGGVFKKSKVTIRVYEIGASTPAPKESKSAASPAAKQLQPENKWEEKATEFLNGLIERMGFSGEVFVRERSKNTITFDLSSPDSGRIIGKQGKNLDALQTLLNNYINNLSDGSCKRMILDAENYRKRNEEKIIQMAREAAQDVISNRSSLLLQPMNPFERRLIHVELNDNDNVATISEGDGLYKQVRVIYKGAVTTP